MPMKILANSSAAVSACTAAISWMTTVEMTLRILGTAVAIVAGVLGIILHLRQLRKRDKK